jgi:hypothetical protein
MLLAMLVLPTPGGPCSRMMRPWVVPFSWLTAMNSSKRSWGGPKKAGRVRQPMEHFVHPTISEIPHNLVKEPKLVQYTRGELSEGLFEAAAVGGVWSRSTFDKPEVHNAK